MAVSLLTGGPVIRVAPEASLLQVADVLTDAGIGAVIVGGVDRPRGIVSERDVVTALAARRDPETTCAGDIAHLTLVWCDAGSSVAEVAELMMERYVRHVLVEEDGRLVGIVSARDLLGAYAGADMADPSDMDVEDGEDVEEESAGTSR
jgi:CBS domain-containing protein